MFGLGTKVRLVAVLLLVGVVGAELILKFGLGLGDPLLYIAHPTIEYLPRPGHYQRWGKQMFINRYSMRTREFPAQKQDPNEERVLCLGDSILFGGAQVDDGELATRLLESGLHARTGRPTLVANTSAGSWGPMNLEAFVAEFGLFDADVVVVVLNTQDPEDIPSYGPLDADHAATRPITALGEVIERRALPYFQALLSAAKTSPASPSDLAASLLKSERALESLVSRTQAAGARTAWVLHERRDELEKPLGDNALWLARVAERLGVPLVHTRDDLEPIVRQGTNPYRDELHLSPSGQGYLAQALSRAVTRAADAAP
jgi:GDSL-like Lipase/Acylhydrolase family